MKLTEKFRPSGPDTSKVYTCIARAEQSVRGEKRRPGRYLRRFAIWYHV